MPKRRTNHSGWPAPLLFMLLLLTFSGTGMAQGVGSIAAEFSVTPETVVVGETDFTLTITLRGDASACPIVISNRPVDAVLVLDVSSSMDGDPLIQTQQAAKVFVDTMTLDVPRPADLSVDPYDGDQVGLVAFSGSGVEVAPLSTSSSMLDAAIDSLSIDSFGGTHIAGGLEQGVVTLNNPTTQNPLAARVIVILSDGEDQSPDVALLAASRAKAGGIRIVTIGLGAVVDNADAREFLEEIASSRTDYYPVRTPAELPEIFEQIANTIQPTTAGTNIRFDYRYDATVFDVDIGSIFPPPSQVNDNTITWVFGRVDGGEAPGFSFRARARQTGTFQVGQIVNSSYMVCESTATDTITGDGPVVIAQLPTPTPLPTATFTPLPTATPEPTPTPTPPAAVIGGFIPAGTSDSSLGQVLGFCADGIGSLLPLLIALLIILLLLLPWLLWHWRRLRNGKCNALCFLMWSIFGAYAAFALWLFLLPPAVAACEGRESVYFWRQEGASRLTGIYLTAPNLSSSTGFSQMNANGCVGCHVVSSSADRVAAIQGPPPNNISIRAFDGTEVIRAPVDAVYLSFSPDGNRIVYADSEPNLYILDITTGNVSPLPGASEPGIVETMPSWGPDGRIAFVRAPDLSGSQYGGLYFVNPIDIYTIEETGGTAIPLQGASGGGFNYYPAYSPDGRWIAFTRHNNATTYSDPEAEIFVVPATGGTAIRLNANDDANGRRIPGASNSWATWSLDSRQLAFNSKRVDELYDIYITTIDETGQSGAAQPLSAAAQRGVFEHTPFWGLPISRIDVLASMGALWPFLLPLLPLALLAWVSCRRRTVIVEPEPVLPDVRPLPPPPIPEPLRLKPLPAPWQPQPSLIIGLGGTGRQVLTHLKKTLRDAQLGEMPVQVRLIGLDTGDYKTLYGETAPIRFAGVELDSGEIIELKDNLEPVVRNQQFRNDPQTRGWLTDDALRIAGAGQRINLAEGANKMRLLARAGLLHHLQSASPNFFDRLIQLAPACLTEDEQLNITIVGDTFGDIGSAVLFDVALLAREAGARIGAGSVSITAHLVTAEAIRGTTNNREQDLANTGATLREIERFQLAEARPFPIFYPQIKKDVCDRMPLDDLYLYDGAGMEQVKPEEGIFPSVADAIALWMDKASGRGELRQMQADQRRSISQAQIDTYAVHVFSQGVFTYRVPFADILESIRARFAQEIFRLLVMGRSVGDEQLRLDVALNGDNDYISGGNTPDDVARAFLTGAWSVRSNRPAPVYALLALRALIDSSYAHELIPALRRLEGDARERMQSGLRAALGVLLNGREETVRVDIFKARGGKVGFALTFLDAIERRIDAITPSLESVRDATDKRDQLKAVLDELKIASASARERLEAQAQALGLIDGVKDNLNALLGRRSFDLAARLTEMQQIASRRYIASRPDENGNEQELATAWYRLYLNDKRGAALGQFYWKVDDSGLPTLLLYGETETPLDPADPAAFERALIEMATRYCTDIRDNALLSDLLAMVELSEPARVSETDRTLRGGARVLLNYEMVDAPLARVDTILAVNETVSVDSLSAQIAQYVGGAAALKRMNSTDPYSLTLNQRAAIVPFSAIRTLAEAREYYRRNHNLSADPRAPRRERPIPTAVYEAEAVALMLEARILAELRLRPDLLHPLVVTALTRPERVTAFTLTLAAGELALEKKLKGQQRRTLVLYTDNGTVPFPETFRGRAIASDLHPLAQGLLMFILDQEIFPDSMVVEMIRRFQTDDTLNDIFKQWVDGAWQEWLDQVDEQDEKSYDVVNDILKVSRLFANQYRQ